jgi:error-prone DNA polymerase
MGYYPSHVLVAEARRFGVEVLPPDINKSSEHYTVENGAIRVSLKQLKGMSEKALESILSARAERKFTSLRDFVLRTDVSQPILENLVKVGAFDSLGDRNDLLLQLPKLSELKRRVTRSTASLFEDAPLEADISLDFSIDDKKSRLFIERELLSLNLSAHPLDFYDSGNGITKMKDLPSTPAGRRVRLVGSVIRYQTPPTRNGKRVVYVIMEDGTGIADVTVFSDVQEKCGQVLFREGWLTVEGKVQKRGQKATSIIAEELYPPHFLSLRIPRPLSF